MNLAGVDLRWATFDYSDFIGADLTGAILSGANFIGTDFSEAILTGANLTRANLTGAVLSDASLEGAQLTQAYLIDADLDMANLKDIRIERTVGNSREICSAQLSFYSLAWTATQLCIGEVSMTHSEWWKGTPNHIEKAGVQAVKEWHNNKNILQQIVRCSPAVPYY
jgi:hypothetical protein